MVSLFAALLVGNDQLNEVKLKNHLGADFFDVASEEEVANVVQAGFGSLGPVGLPENVKIIADRKVQDVPQMQLSVLTKMATT